MSKEAYNDQVITQYLLGSLSEAEAERLDELSLADDEFAEALRAAEKELVDAYAHGELTGAALERFKSHYLASPRRREQAQFAEAFRHFTEREAARGPEAGAGAADKSAPGRQRRGWLSALSVLAAPRPALRWGAACAALLLLAAGFWLVRENARLRGQVSETQARRDALGRREQELRTELEGERAASAGAEQELARVRAERERLERELTVERERQRLAEQERGRQQPSSGGVGVASFVLAPQLRGAGQIQTLTIPPDAGRVAVRLELEPDDYASYRVALLEQPGGRTLWRSRQLRAGGAGQQGHTLGVSFRAGLLRPQTVYALRVTGVAPGGPSEIVGDYSFRVAK